MFITTLAMSHLRAHCPCSQLLSLRTTELKLSWQKQVLMSRGNKMGQVLECGILLRLCSLAVNQNSLP